MTDIGGVRCLCYAPPEVLHEMLLVICFWLISLIFYSITDRDCVAHRPLTACLFFDIVIGRSSSTPVSPGLACGARRCTTRSAARPLRDTVSKPIVPDFSAMFLIYAASSFVLERAGDRQNDLNQRCPGGPV